MIKQQKDPLGPAYDPNEDYPLDPASSRANLVAGVSGRQGLTDPTTRDLPGAPSPAATTLANDQGPQDQPDTPAPAPPEPPPPSNPIPTNPDGSQVGGGTPWLPGATQPSSAPPGYHWDPNMASFEPDPVPSPTTTPAANPAESAIDALYAKYGIKDGGRGSGFADRAYWLEHPSEILNGRLERDLAGTGSDEWTGTPGTGPWQNSGAHTNSSSTQTGSSTSAPPVPQASPITLPPVDTEFNQHIRDLLLQQLQGLSTPTTADSADLAPTIQAYNTQSQRDQQAEREALAERFYASGGSGTNSGAFNTAVQQGMETASGQRANFTGTTVYNAAQAKRQQLQAMMQTAVNAGLTDSAQKIQQQIAAIDANLRQQGITNQSSQFSQSLSQQDQQYYNALALQYAQLQAQLNRDTLTAGLG